jgi:glycosyltransferase involved in cell wall biosynthesis
MKKILIISESINEGGAAIAARRVGDILKNRFKINYLFNNKKKFLGKCKNFVSRLILKFFDDKNPNRHSLNIFTRIKIDEAKFDLINLHWIGNETISLKRISEIKKPILWTLHDMWAFCGSEHFTTNNRYMTNYSKRPYYEKGIDINKFIWKIKKKYLDKKKVTIIATSQWILRLAKKSSLLKNFNIHCIYNPIDINVWNRISRKFACNKLGLNLKKKYILFSAHGGLYNQRKGSDLFVKSLNFIQNLSFEYEIIILGGYQDYKEKINNFNFHFFKFEKNEQRQVLFQSVANVVVIPSRQENLPQIAVESALCKNPIVSFNIAGFNEIIKHKKNGYLANPFDVKDFAFGITQCTKIKNKDLLYRQKYIIKKFNKKIILHKYDKIIRDILKE